MSARTREQLEKLLQADCEWPLFCDSPPPLYAVEAIKVGKLIYTPELNGLLFANQIASLEEMRNAYIADFEQTEPLVNLTELKSFFDGHYPAREALEEKLKRYENEPEGNKDAAEIQLEREYERLPSRRKALKAVYRKVVETTAMSENLEALNTAIALDDEMDKLMSSYVTMVRLSEKVTDYREACTRNVSDRILDRKAGKIRALLEKSVKTRKEISSFAYDHTGVRITRSVSYNEEVMEDKNKKTFKEIKDALKVASDTIESICLNLEKIFRTEPEHRMMIG